MATQTKLSAPLPQDYSDILQILSRLPDPDVAAAQAALAGLADLSPEQRALRSWLARWQGRAAPRLNHPRLSVFAANHGCAPPDLAVTTAASLAELSAPDSPMSRLAATVDADVRLYEMNLAAATRDFRRAASMDFQPTLQAITYGMMAVEPGLDILAVAACGEASALAAVVLLAAALEQDVGVFLRLLSLPTAWAELLQPVVQQLQNMPPCAMLETVGGTDIAAMFGALLAAAMARTPVIITDGAGLAALALLQRLDPQAGRHVALAGRLVNIAAWPQALRVTLEETNSSATDGLCAIAKLQTVV